MNGARTLALAAIPGTFFAGNIAARAWLGRAPARLATDLAQPLVVVTAWGEYGSVAFGILAATVAVATLAVLVAASRATDRATEPELVTRTIVVVAALALAAAGTWPFVFSSDAYAYAAYADLAARGLDPYRSVPPAIHDAFVDAARLQWSGAFPPDIYGPASLAVARGVVSVAGNHGVAATLAAFRILAGLTFLASIALLGIALEPWGARRRFVALCAYGLNPVVLWSVAEGHNDTLLLCFVCGGAVAIRYARPLTGAVALGLSPLFKAPGALLAVGFALDAVLRRRDGSRLVVAVALGLAASVAVALPPLLPALRLVERHGRYAPSISLQGLLGPAPVLTVAAAAVAAGAARLWGGRYDGHAWLGLGIALALPNLYPWYGLWLVPWAIAARGGKVAWALWSVTIFATIRYLPDAVGNMSAGALHLAAVIAALPLLLVFVDLGHVPRPKKVTATT